MARKSDMQETEDVLNAARAVPDGFKVRDFSIPLSKPGAEITGIYLGKGTPKKMKKGKVNTYLIERDDGAKVVLLGANQIDQFFETVKVKQRIYIKRLGQRKAGRYGRLNDYLTAVED